MAQNMVRIEDSVYTELKKRADNQGRSATNLANYYLKKEFGYLPGQEHGTPLSGNTPSPKNTNVSDLVRPDIVKKSEANASSVVTPQDTRTKGDILADIRETEAARDEELRYCQDAETVKKITDSYAGTISDLWNEFHLTKE